MDGDMKRFLVDPPRGSGADQREFDTFKEAEDYAGIECPAHTRIVDRRPTNPPNPKKRYGDLKVPLGLVPSSSIIFEALALKQGAEKYGPYNWRETGVEAMTYVHAAERHLRAWLDGEEMDPESGIPHLGHAKACLGILIDADECGKLIDNRPLPAPTGDLLFVWAADDIMAEEDTPTVAELMQRRREALHGESVFGPIEGYVDDAPNFRRRWAPPKPDEAGPTTAPTDWWSGYVAFDRAEHAPPFTSHRTMAEIMETEERQNAAFGEGDETPMPTGDCLLDGRNCPPDHEHPHIHRWRTDRLSADTMECSSCGMTQPIVRQKPGQYAIHMPEVEHPTPKWDAMTKRACMCERGRCKVDNGWTLGLDIYCCQGERG